LRRDHQPEHARLDENGGRALLRRLVHVLDVQGSSWDRIVRAAAEEVCHHLGAAQAQLYLVDPSGEFLEHAGIWEVGADARLRSSGTLDTVPLNRDQGLPGRVWLERQAGWVLDLRTEAATRRDPRRHHDDARTAVAFPLQSGGAVFGVLEFWFSIFRRLDAQQLEEVEPALRILGESLGRLRAEERLADQSDRSFVLILSSEEPFGRGRPATARPREAELDSFPIVFANSAVSRITGYSLRGCGLGVLMGNETEHGTADRIATALARGERIATEFLAYRKDRSQFLMRLDISPVPDARGGVSHFVAVPPEYPDAIGAATVRRGEADPLTGLANRVLLNNSLRRALERAEKGTDYRFALLFLDLDDFKRVNDAYGHMLGDHVLVAVARQLESAVRPGDIVARYGGDEFVVLLDVVGGIQPVLTVAERIRDRLSRPLRLPGRDLIVSASIGIALSDTGHKRAEDILTEADAAMYLAKQEGGARYRIFDLALQEAAMATQQTRAALKTSLERGEFRLHYQPMVELASDGITGMEALLRWDHPERGVLPAGDFIAEAEDMGLILPIGRWVIHEACRQVRAWQDELPPGTPLVLSVNLSARELLDPGLAAHLQQSLEETGADPRSLRFEIPEGFFALPRSDARDALRPLIDLGVRIAIGDFGSGFASLGLLPRLPVDCLKIDRHYVADLRENGERRGENARAVRSILALAESLGIPVTASGVETSGQREALERLACRYAQGNFFSEPVDARGAAILLRRAWTRSPERRRN
jgi:diguanylate cyclase (GGDEF)-like protein